MKIRLHSRSLAIACSLIAASISVSAQSTVRTVANLPSYKDLKFPALRQPTIPNPEVFTLSNGMKVYLLEHHELPIVSGFALVRTGNLFDPPDKKGLAEVTGSIIRSGGTKTKTGDQIDEALENIAASIESNIGEERGTVSFSCLKENTDQVLALYHDILTAPEFRQDKLDLAKTQLRSAIARRNDEPAGIVNREFQSIVFGRTSPYGWMIEYSDVDNIQRQDLIEFYKRYYFPANITMAVYGDFSTADMKARLERQFADWTYNQPPVPKFPEFKSKPDSGIFLAEKSDVTQTFFEIGHIGGMLSDKDYPALQVAADILGSGFTSRLMRKVRTELGFAYSIGANWGAGYAHPGLFEISGSTKSGSTAQTIEVIEQELERLRTSEVTDEELKTAKDTVLNSFVFFFDTPAKTLNRLVLYDYFGYPRDFIFRYQKAVATVTKADVLRVSKQYLKPSDLTIVAVGNAAQFGRPLTTLKIPVKKLDLTIPEPGKAAPKSDAGSLQRGNQLLQRAQQAVGGAAKLTTIRDFTRVADTVINAGGNQMKGKQTTRVIEPSTFRQDQELPFGKISVYYDGKSGWMAAPQGSQPLPQPIQKQVLGELSRQLPILLTRPEANYIDKGTIDVGGDRLVIDEKTGMPLKVIYEMNGQKIEETYSDWRDVNGIKMPFKSVIEQGGKRFGEITTTDLKLNTGLTPEELSKKP
jgi:zinc protease